MHSIRWFLLIIPFFIISCKQKTVLVNPVFADSLMTHFSIPEIAKNNDSELAFWEKRMNPNSPGLINEARYSAALITRFQEFGNIKDLKEADRIMRKVDTAFNHKEAGPIRSLISYSIMEHRFKIADDYLKQGEKIGLKKYESQSLSFDVDFELGRYNNAYADLKGLYSTGDFGYYFRRSRFDHFNGTLDSAISAMLKASTLSENIPLLKQVALSNSGDLFIHAGDLSSARDQYMESIRMGRVDFHSVIGLGWIALIKDRNDSLADRLFQFVHAHNKLPDALFKMVQVADARGDSMTQKSRALVFEKEATDSLFERMYNKYLIELYTGILNQPARALSLAKDELNNRATPQTYAWYCWSLVSNNKNDEAYKIFRQYVSGKPLEGLELYWMGKMMSSLGKGYNAQEFYKAAYKNKYDLSPGIVRDLEKNIE